MKKILIASDKFKFTLSAKQVTEAVYKGITSVNDDLFIQKFPLADGGEGTADILSCYFNCSKIKLQVNDPLFKKISIHYYYSSNDHLAIADLSEASGLHLLKDKERNPLFTSTYGTGEIIADALKRGAKKIIIGIGGSATNDAGIGAANALGYKFIDKKGKELKPVGKNLIHIYDIDDTNSLKQLNDVKIDVLCDVNNILYGKTGAAYVYSKQKGATKAGIKLLDEGLKNFTKLIKKKNYGNISNIKGGGAAGGFGAGAYALLNANLIPGSDYMLQLSDFDSIIKDTDLIITGEGKFDNQSFQGKITGKIIEKAERKKISVIVICGKNELDLNRIKYKNIISILPLFVNKIDINIAKDVSFNLIVKTTQHLFRNLKLL